MWLSPNQSVLCIPPADAAAEIRTPTTTIQRGQRGLIRIRRDIKSKKENRTSRGERGNSNKPPCLTTRPLHQRHPRLRAAERDPLVPNPGHPHPQSPYASPSRCPCRGHRPCSLPPRPTMYGVPKARQSTEVRSTCVLLYLGLKRNEKPFGSQPQVSGLQDSGVERGQGSQAARHPDHLPRGDLPHQA